jgi:enoyl-CoA hydratase
VHRRLAIRGSKEMLVYSRDHSVADGLNYIATWNAAMFLSADLDEAMTAAKENLAMAARNSMSIVMHLCC